jgi:beta-lactam-binding protein with PASTA domain
VATVTTDVQVEQRWIEIPSVFGMTVREASERLAAAGFTPAASPRRFTADRGTSSAAPCHPKERPSSAPHGST